MVSRRGFLTGMLALGAAPAIVRAESLMRLWVPPQEVLTLDAIRRAASQLMANRMAEPYFVVIDPAHMEDFSAICTGWISRDSGIYISGIHHG
jgi:hypothetical protein